MKLRILFVEDSPDDIALVLRRLQEAGIEVHWQCVESDVALREAIAGDGWDLALVDYNLPGFGGPQALAVLAEEAPDVPAITVSGAIDEETAVTTIRAGAVDYVLKDNLTRLAPAVRRAVEGAELRRKERRAAEQARQSEALYRRIVEMASEGIWAVDDRFITTFVNQQMALMLGYEPDEMIGRMEADFMFDGDGVAREAARQARTGGLPGVYERRLKAKDGGEVWMHISSIAELGPEGEFLGAYALCTDMTERKRAFEALRESEARLRVTLEATEIAIWDWDITHDLWYASPQYYAMLGYEPVGGPSDRELWLSRIHPEDRAGVAAKIGEVRRGADAHYEYEARMLHADGSYRWHRVVGHTVECDQHGAATRMVGVRMDIDERRQSVEALRQSEGQLRTLIDTLPDLVWLKDLEGVYLSCNRRFESFFGAQEQDIVGKTDYDFTSKDLADFFRQRDREAAEAGEPTANEEEIVFAEDGHREILETIKTPIRASDGRPIGVLGVGRDITERKRSEEEARRQAEQLRRTLEGAVLAMSNVVESRDPYTAGHERRVAELAVAIAEDMGIAGEKLTALRLAGLIHDIGKIAVPAEILARPGRLSDVEFSLIKQHPLSGFDILRSIDFGYPVAELVVQHHERLDGSGYPEGLSGEAILPEARILAVADVVEAMSSHRPYRAALGMDAALAEVREHAGVKYDADVVAVCVRLIEEQGFQFTP